MRAHLVSSLLFPKAQHVAIAWVILLCALIVVVGPAYGSTSQNLLPTIYIGEERFPLLFDTTDTFCLYGGVGSPEGTFQDPITGVIPDWQGWVGVDQTTDGSAYWQRSTYNASNLLDPGAIGANDAFWCGQSAAQKPGWSSAPGYGNGWFEILMFESPPLADTSIGQIVGLDFFFNHDTEPGYDFFEVQYDSAGVWTTVLALDGSNKDGFGVFAAPGVQYSTTSASPIVFGGNDYDPISSRIRIRMVVSSDNAWSDEDGLWNTDGAIQVDNITVIWSDGISSENFEGPGPYAWMPEVGPFAGDFSKVFPRVRDLDPTKENATPVVGFMDDGSLLTGGTTSSDWAYGIPGGWVVNYNGGLSFGLVSLDNSVWSPEIAWDLPGPEDDHADIGGALLEFLVWRHLPLQNGIFYTWAVRSSANGGATWTDFRDYNLAYYGTGLGDWLRQRVEVGPLLVDNPTHVQIALGVVDLADALGLPGNDATPSPLFDNVALCKYRVGGPTIIYREADLFQDSFAHSGATAVGTPAERDLLDVRIDMARDIDPGQAIVRGDSLIVKVRALGQAGISNPNAQVLLHWTLDVNPLFEPALRGANPGVVIPGGAPNGWDQYAGTVGALQSSTGAGVPIPDLYFFDLPDSDFMYPGDRLRYYISATDDDGRTTRVPPLNSGNLARNSPTDEEFEKDALPTYNTTSGDHPPLLLIIDGLCIEYKYDSALKNLGLQDREDYDVFEVLSPDMCLQNGIGSDPGLERYPEGLAGFRGIIYESGNLECSLDDNDASVIEAWHRFSGDRIAIYFGDNLVSSSPETFVPDVLGIAGFQRDVSGFIGGQLSPVVRPVNASLLLSREYVAYGGSPSIHTFDNVTPGLGAEAIHEYLTTTGQASGVAASVLWDRNLSPETRNVDITFPYSFASIWNRRHKQVEGNPVDRAARVYLLEELLTYYGVVDIGPRTATEHPSTRALTLDVYPSPFNPVTTVALSLPRPSPVSIRIYDIRGRLVRTLFQGELSEGRHELKWDGADNAGAPLASGVYVLRTQTEQETKTRKVALVR